MGTSRTREPGYGKWHPDSTGVFGGYDRTADNVVGAAFSVRFVRDDKPGSLIDVSFYPIEIGEDSGEYTVEREVEWMVCEDPADPGGTEVWSDVTYDDVSGTVIGSAAEAEQEAREHAGAALDDAWKYGGWDGEPR